MAVNPAATSDAAQFTGVNPQMIVALTQLLPSLFGSRTNTTQSVQSAISPQASGMTDSVMAALLPQITGTSQADAVVQNILTKAMQQAPGILAGANQGGYNSSISRLLMQDLIARATGEASGAVLQSQQQAAQTAASLAAATQQNTRQQTQQTRQQTPGQGGNVLKSLATGMALRRGEKLLEETLRRSGRGVTGSSIAASSANLSSLPAAMFSSLGSAGPVASAFGPIVGGTSPFGATVAAGFEPSMFSLNSALGLDLAAGGDMSSVFSSLAGDAASGLAGDAALSGVDGVYSGADLLDFSSFGSDVGVDAATGFALDAGAGLLGDYGADMFAESFLTDAGATLASDAAFSVGVPYFTLARLGSNALVNSDIPVLSDVAQPVADVTNFISEGVGDVVGSVGEAISDAGSAVGDAVGTVICTHMYDYGMITEFQYLHTVAARSAMPDVIRNGYRYWAIPLVKHMEQRPFSIRSRITYALARGYIEKLVAHKHNAKSLFVYGVGVPLCWSIGTALRLLGKTVPRNRAEADAVQGAK